MSRPIATELASNGNPRDQFYAAHGSKLTQESERLFVDEFLYPLLGPNLLRIAPQHPFLDSTGRSRKIDFAYADGNTRLALEVNGETYHAEGIIPNDMFDDNLFRQNEILTNGYRLIRFSYNQLQSPIWRAVVMAALRDFFTQYAPALLGTNPITPNPIQDRALVALDFWRNTKGWRKGIVVLPTGTGKTMLSALDVRRVGGRALFLVHRLDILKQSIDAYRRVWPQIRVGILTGETRDAELECDVLFASKDTLRQPAELARFNPDAFDYIVVDEVHHGQSLSYRILLEFFKPHFMLGMTATPDRLDRKDIFELFDYNKIFEITLQEAIDDGFVVPYDYIGLMDDIDYSSIRLQGNRYRVDDLERFLIIPARNEAILREYLTRGKGDKAIGFCVSIKHAERMAELFVARGVPSAAITNATPDRDERIAAFRRNEISVAFTVDLFNEGMDFPNVRVLLFLRPTESKTVFTQQLGRGLRLCTGKDRVRVLDFIGNYRRANQIRKWLAKSARDVVTGAGVTRRKKVEYTYSNGCRVEFDSTVEQILDAQDEREMEITKDDLKEAYFALAEELGQKPTKDHINSSGRYRIATYLAVFGGWVRFLREIGEYTEASYHYPQGVHLGHLLSILKVWGGGARALSHLDDKFIRLRGGLDDGRLGAYQRQVKYKLQAAMELGILPDDRSYGSDEQVVLSLTPVGSELFETLKPLLDDLNLDFPRQADGVPSSTMELEAREYNRRLREYLADKPVHRKVTMRAFIKMPAVSQMLLYLYRVARQREVARAAIYDEFFKTPFVAQFCDQEGIEEATDEAAKHRCPFLINILDALGIVSQDTGTISVLKLLICAATVRIDGSEKLADAETRALALWAALNGVDALPADQVSLLREQFGKHFLTDEYHLVDSEYLELELPG
jgi:superfamily II DNA or RNA helicase